MSVMGIRKGGRLVDKLNDEYRQKNKRSYQKQQMFNCPACFMSFKSDEEYRRHYKVKHQNMIKNKEQRDAMSKVWKDSVREFV